MPSASPSRPWLRTDISSVPTAWREHLETALQHLDELPLPREFAVTSIYEKRGTLRMDWFDAGPLEDQVQAIALKLEDDTEIPIIEII